ncbi:hypothetical protein HK100_001433 [Physocladia obscura]|uniref:Membrane magnesium transporter n=1 Tax=Physocladia obscura TaxID=109957 RepID=A0AAD5XLK6_9FUNG|nr:hypothetical protein HK100_001433 [Physocladia obscura]
MTLTSTLGSVVLAVGVVLLLHSGYSAAEHLAFVKATRRGSGDGLGLGGGEGLAIDALPLEIGFECLVGVLVGVVGIVFAAGAFRPVVMARDIGARSMDVLLLAPSFKLLNSRAISIYKHSTFLTNQNNNNK